MLLSHCSDIDSVTSSHQCGSTSPGLQASYTVAALAWRDVTLLQALDRLADERYDAVIVDEARDFQEYWWVAVEKLLRLLV